jgi:hypothetical protein
LQSAAGGGALVTTVQDLACFLDALFKGRLFRHCQTLRQMLAIAPAQGGLVGYSLGIDRRVLPGGAELIGYLGGTAGYHSYLGRLRPQNVTLAFALNWLRGLRRGLERRSGGARARRRVRAGLVEPRVSALMSVSVRARRVRPCRARRAAR